MKIAIATPVLFERSSPYNHLFRDILSSFLAAGHTVTRLVAVRDEGETDYTFGLDQIACQTYRRRESAQKNIISRYLRDTLTAIRQARGLRRTGADLLFEDVCYCSFWPVRAAKKSGMRVVAMLQDVWPDNAVQSGLIREGGVLYRYFEAWQRYVYRQADKIICISDDMRDFLVSKGVEEKKITVIYNWGYRDEAVHIPWEENLFVRKYQLKRDFYAVYAGNIGKMQNVELVVQAAKALPAVQFLIIGDGAKRDKIAALAAGLQNVRMLPLQPPELAEHIYSMAGVNIIPLVEGGPKTAMPSKTGVVLSCGRPVVFCFGAGTRFAALLEEYGAGTSVSATDARELAAAILTQRDRQESAGPGAAPLFRARFARDANMSRYAQALAD